LDDLRGQHDPPRTAEIGVWTLALLAGFLLRVLPLTAARPYTAYFDEGYALQPAARMVRDGGWDPGIYRYGQLPMIAVASAVRAVDPLYLLLRGRSLRERIPEEGLLYDDLEPFPLLLIGRSLCVLAGMGIVVLAGLLARRLGGPAAGAAAAAVAALTPALVLRGPIASIDPYATFFALACVYLTERSRSGEHAGAVSHATLASFAAGLAAGLACASKYPAVLVILVFPATTALLPLPVREKLRRIALAAVGLVVGGIAGMPIALVRTAEILKAARYLRSTYESWAAPYLLDQALVRAEWDLDFARPELGATFVLLALAGFAVGLRERETRATMFGIGVFAAVSLVFVSSRSFQPFRNILALVPLACVAIGLVFATVRARLRRPLWADLLVAAWLLGVYAAPLAAYTRARCALADPRTLTLDWVVRHAGPQDRVLLMRDAAFLDQELERLGGRASASWFDLLAAEAERTGARFLILGTLSRPGSEPEDLATQPSIRTAYVERYCTGTLPTPADPERWRGNDQHLCVFERR
jgi:hypothetical protein